VLGSGAPFIFMCILIVCKGDGEEGEQDDECLHPKVGVGRSLFEG
jgi:hypothetical protein